MSSYEELFRKNFKGLSYFAMEYVKDHDIAREIVQDAFVSLWEKRHSIDTGRSPGAYLSSMVRNRCLNYLRDNRKFDRSLLELEGLDLQADHEVQDHLVAEELKNRIEETTQSLPDKCREVFVKNRIEHKKYQEIADEMNISLKTVEAQMSKALRIMREKLSDFIMLIMFLLEFIHRQ